MSTLHTSGATPSNSVIRNGRIVLSNEKSALWIAEQLAIASLPKDQRTPANIARAVKEMNRPTPEQVAIIESKHWGPAIVAAGAGSGKTETMSQRVLWLVVNGVVRPEEILGLTFTRKAAGELATRIRKRLRQLHSVGALPKDPITKESINLFVDVSTYHSYAGSVLSQYGIRLGIDAQSAPMAEAAAWLHFHSVVTHADSHEFVIDDSLSKVVEKVIALSSQVGEHDVDWAELERVTRAELEEFGTVPPANDPVRNAIATAQLRLEILHMARDAFELRKKSGRFTYDDQMSLAAKLAVEIPDIATHEREKYKVVLLDEYQDTSQSQIRFLSGLYGAGFPVTAVGDPNQAIYSWRGASAGTMAQFPTDFTPPSGTSVEKYELLTSWRNDKRILDFANLLVRASNGSQSSTVQQLVAKPNVADGELFAARYLTQHDEAEGIADYIQERWNASLVNQTSTSTFAVLTRSKNYIPSIDAALRKRGIPTEVVGLSGLIHIPEIADIIALLRIAIFPDAGVALARLVTGPYCALGVRDLRDLGLFSRELAEGSKSSVARGAKGGRSKTLERLMTSGDEITNLDGEDFAIGSLVDAVERIDEAPQKFFSAEGRARLNALSRSIASFRRELGGSIVDAVLEAERFLHLDSEVLLRDGWQNGRKNLDAFLDEAANFQRTGGTLSSFLEWLEVADDRENGLKTASATESHDAVQILTVHGAKGAEWDYVVIPGLVKATFPSTGKGSPNHITNAGSIPLELRGDTAQFPFSFEMPDINVAKPAAAVRKAIEAFKHEWDLLEMQEEFRVGYVAFTRARHGILATSSHYKSGKKPVDASEFFVLLSDSLEENNPDAIIHRVDGFTGVDENGDYIQNPEIDNPPTESWPRENRVAERVQETAVFVSKASPLSSSYTPQEGDEASLIHDAELLLKEISSRRNASTVYLPSRLSVSTVIALKKDPDSLALNLRRPMPNHANPFARRGTLFHEWIERYFGQSTLFDDDDLQPHPLPPKDEKALDELKQLWLSSEWAARTPHDVESGFETVVAGTVIKGRIDAVYRTIESNPDGSEAIRYEVVDWKTGRQPQGEEFEAATIQLAMYRLAYSILHNIPLENVSAAFFYLPEQKTVRPADLMGIEELTALITAVPLD